MIKNLIPVMALVAVLAVAPAEAASVKEMADSAKGMAAKAVNALVVRPAQAAKAFVVDMAHLALSLAGVGVEAGHMVVDSAAKAADEAAGQ